MNAKVAINTRKSFLNVLPKCTAMSIYSYSLDEVHILKLQQAHNPILREVPWQRMPQTISWLDGAKLTLKFQ